MQRPCELVEPRRFDRDPPRSYWETQALVTPIAAARSVSCGGVRSLTALACRVQTTEGISDMGCGPIGGLAGEMRAISIRSSFRRCVWELRACSRWHLTPPRPLAGP